jgi:Ni/Co efflux regulator RcnB
MVLAVLLLGAAAPALAAGAPDDRHGWQHSGRQSASEERSDRSSGNDRPHSNRGDRGDRNDQAAPQPQQQQAQPQQPVARVVEHAVEHRVETSGGGNADHRPNGGFRGRFSGGEQPAIQPTGHDDGMAPDSVRNWRSQERHATGPKMVEPGRVFSQDGARGTLRQHDRALPNVFRNRVPIVSNVPREGTQPPARLENHRNRTSQWSASHWRNDRRYDWRSHRHHHRSLFHLGFYYDPFGWSYNPFQIGWRMWPNYYSSRYWISDPWEYRLPYAPPGYRWVRYWDDAVLVDTFTGEVVDVINNFFW